MSQTNDGGNAFPHYPAHGYNEPHSGTSGGMSLRAWLAGQAMAGYLADPRVDFEPGELIQFAAEVAGHCVAFADALLAALEAK